MSNKDEFQKVLQIVHPDEYPSDKRFVDTYIKKFNSVRQIMYIVLFAGSFYLLQEGRIIPDSYWLRMGDSIAIIIFGYMYLGQRKIIKRELNGYIFRECRPDIAVSRYLSFVSSIIKKQVAWSFVHYNFGVALYRHGRIEKANAFLGLMQDSCKTANNMLLAVHLKLLIALYYRDYGMVIACANEAEILYRKSLHRGWYKKIYGDIQRAGIYANCCKNNDYQQILSVLKDVNERPVDEVARQYYLYLAAKEMHDFEKIEKYRDYVRKNAGTTWYGQAVEADFVSEEKPANYPGFNVSFDKISNPDKVDRSRLKYFLIGALIALLFYLLPKFV